MSLANYANRLDSDRLCIFLFHGVVERFEWKVRNYTRKHLLADDFTRLLRLLKAQGAPLSMDQVIEIAQAGRPWPPRAFAITFDDGFANNAEVAAPILDGLGLPCTFYLTTGLIEDNGMSWVDRLEALYEELEEVELDAPWRRDRPRAADPAGKIALLTEIRRRVKGTPGLDVDDFVARQFAVNRLTPITNGYGPLDRKLTWEQVRSLAANPLHVLGGHTHTHAIMSHLDPEGLEREISTSLQLLREKTGIGPRHYAYPEGLAHCYNGEVIAALKSHGVECCPTAIDGTNASPAQEQDLFHLRRVMVA